MNNTKKQFLEENKFKESIEKSYMMVFKKMKIAETRLDKDFKDFTYEEILTFLPCIESSSYQSINIKWTLSKKYLDYFGNLEGQKITQDDLKKYIVAPFKKYATRDEIMGAIENLANPQDKAIVLLLFEGIMGKGYGELASLKTESLNFEDNTITLEDRVLDVPPSTMAILKETKEQKQYEKFGEGGSRGDSSYEFNMASPYLIKSKPSKRNNNGLGIIKEAGIKARLDKITKSINMPYITGLSIYHSGLIEKLQVLEEGHNQPLGKSDVAHYLNRLGVEKFEPNNFVRALKYFGELKELESQKYNSTRDCGIARPLPKISYTNHN